MNAPQIYDKKNLAKPFTDFESKKVLPTEPVTLLENQWAIVYASSSLDEVKSILSNLKSASSPFGMQVEDPLFIEVSDELEKAKDLDFISTISERIDPIIIRFVLVVVKERIKPRIKACLDKMNIVSQFILTTSKAKQ